MEHPKLLALTSDVVFRALFTRSPNSLIDLLNAALSFEGTAQIEKLALQPAELFKEHAGDKSAVLDIKAQSLAGDLFHIEMQTLEQHFYSARALYYWARLYTSQLRQGENYTTLQRTYSIHFLNFNLLKLPHYQSNFLILEKDHPTIQLSDRFQMVFFELPKFTRTLDETDDKLELWLYIENSEQIRPGFVAEYGKQQCDFCFPHKINAILALILAVHPCTAGTSDISEVPVMKHTPSLDEAAMRTIVDKNPVMQETLQELRGLSIDPQLLSIEEARRKAKLDYNTNMLVSREMGRAEGKAEGLAEGKAEGRGEGLAASKIESARVMLENHYPLEEISKITGLSPDQIREAGLIGTVTTSA